MSKAVVKTDLRKLLMPVKGEGAYGYVEIEMSQADLDKYGRVISACEPDIFAVCVNNFTKKIRDMFDI